MIELTIKDADTIISYLRDKLILLNVKRNTMGDAVSSYINKDNEEINNFVDMAVPLDERESFEQFIEMNIKQLDDEIDKLKNYIYLLTAGSDKE